MKQLMSAKYRSPSSPHRETFRTLMIAFVDWMKARVEHIVPDTARMIVV